MDIEIKQEGENKFTAHSSGGGKLTFEKHKDDLIKTTFFNMRGMYFKWSAPAWLISALLFKVRAKGVAKPNESLELVHEEFTKQIMENYTGSEMMGRLDMLQHYCNKISDLLKVEVEDEEKSD